MKFTCTRKELTDILRIICKATAVKTDTPILSGIYIETEDNKITLQSTDNKIGFICHIPVEVNEPGKIVIAAKYFQEVISKLSGEKVTLHYNSDTNTTKITSDNANFTLLSMNSDDFPVITPLQDGTSFTIKSEILQNLIRKTSFACSTDDSRPLFTGCNLNIDEGKLVMVSTNTHRLAIKEETITDEGNKIKITIPAKVLNDLTPIIGTNSDDIKIVCTESKIGFFFGDNYLFSGIIKGDFPDYKKAIPPQFKTMAKVKTAEFLQAIERIALISRTNEYNIVKMNFTTDTVTITSQNPKIGKAEETLAIELTGENLNIAFNAQYMIDILKIVDSPDIEISMNTNISPISIKETEDDSFLYISTPVRTTN